MGHGSHFIAELAGESIIPGTIQLNILKPDGTIDRTIGLSPSSFFKWHLIASKEDAMKLAGMLTERNSYYGMSLPDRLMIESGNNHPPEERHDDGDEQLEDSFPQKPNPNIDPELGW
jgi:hypothetical protein